MTQRLLPGRFPGAWPSMRGRSIKKRACRGCEVFMDSPLVDRPRAEGGPVMKPDRPGTVLQAAPIGVLG